MKMGGVIMSVLMVMVIFYGAFNYISDNYISSGITIPGNYSNSYTDLQAAQDSLNTSTEGIKNATRGIAEADGNILTIAWNGLTGLASTLRLFIGIIDISLATWDAILPGLSFLPGWLKLLTELAIIITIILVIIGLFKGENKT